MVLAAAEAAALVPAGADILVVGNWDEGMGKSLRQTLAAARGAAVVTSLVDLPDRPPMS